MKWAWTILLAIPLWGWLHSVAHRNTAREAAWEALAKADYRGGIEAYRMMLDSLEMGDDSVGEVQLALRHVYLLWGMERRDSIMATIDVPKENPTREQLEKALAQLEALKESGATDHLGMVVQWDSALLEYQKLGDSPYAPTRSIARNEMGVVLAFDNEEEALSHFKQALKADPTNESARYNYELLKKYLAQKQEEEDNSQSPNQPEPSEYAKQLKKQADQWVAKQDYARAAQIMEEGVKKDPTVEHYRSFIDRVSAVAQIEAQN